MSRKGMGKYRRALGDVPAFRGEIATSSQDCRFSSSCPVTRSQLRRGRASLDIGWGMHMPLLKKGRALLVAVSLPDALGGHVAGRIGVPQSAPKPFFQRLRAAEIYASALDLPPLQAERCV